jgi:ceramide glucosyltransferase
MAWIVAPGAALVLLLALLARQLEGRRLASKRRFHSPTAAVYGTPVTIVVPLGGPEHSLRDNLASWLLQDWPEREIIFVAESAFDPAVPVAESLVREHRYVPTKIVFSGTTANRGQRVHQLLCGVRHADPDAKVVVFGGADAKAKGDAVRWMVHHLAVPANGAVTGNLWTVPRLQTPANRLAAAIGNFVAGLAGPGRWNLLCQGSWAIRRDDFEALGLPAVWKAVLVETWCSRAAILRAGMGICYEPHCIIESTIETSAARILASGVRKSLAARLYAPCTWWLTLIACVAVLAGFATSIVFAASLLLAGQWLSGLSAVSAGILIYGLGVGAALVRHNTARRLLPAWKQYRSARRFDVQAWPLTGLAMVGTMLASLLVRHVSWRGKRYHIGAANLIRFEGTVPWESILRPGIKPSADTLPLLPIANNADSGDPATHSGSASRAA